MSEYRIWFRVKDYPVIALPVNPQEVTITSPGNPTNYDVEGLGEIVIPRIPKLSTLTFESFFPREKVFISLSNSDEWYSPEWYVSFFKNLQKSRQPFELTIVRGFDNIVEYDEKGLKGAVTRTDYFDTVFDKAVLLDMSITDKGGEPGDVYYNMTISEYKDASPKTLAELAEEDTDVNDEVLNQKMVVVVNRPQQNGIIAVNRTVKINGNVYKTSTSTESEWKMTKGKANQIDRIVSRVLPPSVSGKFHSVYVAGLGWLDKSSCKLSEDLGTMNSISRLVTNNYD